jgi:hypothetical protein
MAAGMRLLVQAVSTLALHGPFPAPLFPSPRSWITTVLPLVFVLAVNAVKEGYDDACRHRNDAQINNRRVLMLDAEEGEVSVFWKDVVAGDLIKVRGGGRFVAGAHAWQHAGQHATLQKGKSGQPTSWLACAGPGLWPLGGACKRHATTLQHTR